MSKERKGGMGGPMVEWVEVQEPLKKQKILKEQ